jgi:hypothetical protein
VPSLRSGQGGWAEIIFFIKAMDIRKPNIHEQEGLSIIRAGRKIEHKTNAIQSRMWLVRLLRNLSNLSVYDAPINSG